MDDTLKIIEEIFDYNKGTQKTFSIAEKIDKENSGPKLEESIAKRVKIRRPRLNTIEEKEKKSKLFSYYFNYSSPNNMLSRLSNIRSEINKNQVYSINKALTKIKTIVRNVPKAGLLNVKENEKIIDIVERILELNSENQLRLGLKILTPNQMLYRIPVSLAQLNAENNSEKLKN